MNQDAEIVARVQSGETESFTELYDAYFKKIYAFIYYKTHHRETAEDLTSQTFLRALNKLADFDSSRGTFQAWLYQIARNGIYDHYRAMKKTTPLEDAWDLSSAENVAVDAALRTELAEVREALQKLKPEQRDIVILRVWQDLSYEEIAEIVGKSVNACKMTFSRTVKGLRKEFILAAALFVLFSLT